MIMGENKTYTKSRTDWIPFFYRAKSRRQYCCCKFNLGQEQVRLWWNSLRHVALLYMLWFGQLATDAILRNSEVTGLAHDLKKKMSFWLLVAGKRVSGLVAIHFSISPQLTDFVWATCSHSTYPTELGGGGDLDGLGPVMQLPGF